MCFVGDSVTDQFAERYKCLAHGTTKVFNDIFLVRGSYSYMPAWKNPHPKDASGRDSVVQQGPQETFKSRKMPGHLTVDTQRVSDTLSAIAGDPTSCDALVIGTSKHFTKAYDATFTGVSTCAPYGASIRNETHSDTRLGCEPLDVYRAVASTVRRFLEQKNFTRPLLWLGQSPSHFKDGAWDSGGHCSPDANVSWLPAMSDQKERVDAFNRVTNEVFTGTSLSMTLLDDITELTWLRPDGHPGRITKKSGYDCLHWGSNVTTMARVIARARARAQHKPWRCD